MGKFKYILPNTELIDEYGNTNKFHDLINNKTIILNMFYSNCEIKCVPLANLMRRVNILLQNYIDSDIQFISITLDSVNDTISDILNFKQKVYNNECQNWHFYTGNFKDIEILRYKLGMYNPDPKIDIIKSNHTGSFMIFNDKTGFTKHTEAFDNPIDICRKILQMITKNFYRHHYDLDNLAYDKLTDGEIFENIQSMNAMFTVSFLPKHIRDKFDKYAEMQRGFNYEPPINKEVKKGCCCKQ